MSETMSRCGVDIASIATDEDYVKALMGLSKKEESNRLSMFRTLILDTTLAVAAACGSSRRIGTVGQRDIEPRLGLHTHGQTDGHAPSGRAGCRRPRRVDRDRSPQSHARSVCDQSTEADTTDLGNNRLQIERDLIIQAFDSGLYTLPPLNYVVSSDTFKTSPLALKVIPVDIDTMTSIHGYAGTVSIPRKFWDYFPDFIADYWIWYVIALVIAGGITAYLLLRKKNIKAVFTPAEKPIPPYEAAMAQLERLRLRKLCERGQEKEFYTELTDILRVYLRAASASTPWR